MKNDKLVPLIKDTEAAVTLGNIIWRTEVLLSRIRKLGPVYQTSTLEAKHSLGVRFVSENISFSCNRMQMRYDHSCV